MKTAPHGSCRCGIRHFRADRRRDMHPERNIRGKKINTALAEDRRRGAVSDCSQPGYERTRDGCGWDRRGKRRGSAGQRYRGAAPEAELIVVKMGIPPDRGIPRTTELMTGVDYVIRKALDMRMPVAVNISFGNTYGSHDGTSLVERFLNDISDTWKNVICIGSGNEGTTAGHAAGRVSDEEEKVVELAVQELEPALNVQIWKSYVDEIDISVVNPSGIRVGPFREILGPQRFVLEGQNF